MISNERFDFKKAQDSYFFDQYSETPDGLEFAGFCLVKLLCNNT